MNKAFRISIRGYDDDDGTGIWIAETASKAKAKCNRAMNALGICCTFADLRCHRTPEYDAWAIAQPKHRQAHGIIERYVKIELQEIANRMNNL